VLGNDLNSLVKSGLQRKRAQFLFQERNERRQRIRHRAFVSTKQNHPWASG